MFSKIITKFTITFLLISLIPISITSYISIIKSQKALEDSIISKLNILVTEKTETIANIINDRINETIQFSSSPELKIILKNTNLLYINKSNDDIHKSIKLIDNEWIKSKGNTKEAKLIFNNPLSKLLQMYKKSNLEKYGEIFVTDIKGATIAMTNTLSDYYQADEDWWVKSYNNGRGSIFLDDRGYDASINTIVIGIAVPIKDNKKVIGILKINFKMKNILDLIAKAHIKNTDLLVLARTIDNSIIVKSRKINHELTPIEKKIMMDNKIAGYIDDIHEGHPSIMVYKQVKISFHSRIPTPGEKLGISGEKWMPTKWFLFIDIEKDEIFAPICSLMITLISINTAVIFIVILLAFLFSKAMSKPILELIEGTKIVGEGNLDYTVNVKTKDEIKKLADAFNKMTNNLKLITASRDVLNKEIEVRNQIEELVNIKIRQLEQANKELEEFGYVASHHLQEPLRTLSSYSLLLREDIGDDLSPRAEQDINFIIDAANRAHRVVNDILDLSRTGRIELKLENVDLNMCMENIIKDNQILISETNAKIEWNNLPIVKGDSTQITRVFQNLISNAIKFQDDHNSHIKISSKDINDMWEISVQDNGIGMEKEYLDQIFLPFKRLNSMTKYKGSGIGLTICRRIIERHGGIIIAESDVGKGTTFKFTIKKKLIFCNS
ncbi:MAG: ATP-binding protein [Spirochaetota bacterium]|nr:ATP-binding protein [Spirochaetota bacterium]